MGVSSGARAPCSFNDGGRPLAFRWMPRWSEVEQVVRMLDTGRDDRELTPHLTAPCAREPGDVVRGALKRHLKGLGPKKRHSGAETRGV